MCARGIAHITHLALCCAAASSTSYYIETTYRFAFWFARRGAARVAWHIGKTSTLAWRRIIVF